MMYVEFMKNSFLADSDNLMAPNMNFGILSRKAFDSYFLDMMHVEFIKNFHLADTNSVIASSNRREENFS